jgi:predicted phosphodiesterase
MSKMNTVRMVVLLGLLFGGCGPKQVLPAHRDRPFTPPKTNHLRLVLIGDTGEPGPVLDEVRQAVKREKKDAVVVLGDLVYPLTPSCPDGKVTGQALHIMDAKVGKALSDLGAPVLLLLGNHDNPKRLAHSPRAACLMDYAASKPELVLPSETYLVDYGVAILAITNTTYPTAADGAAIAQALNNHKGWRVGFGHHVWKTYRDKDSENKVRPWVKKHRIPLDLWANGHAHLLQFGIYDSVAALTSGTGSRPRVRPSCPGRCGAGELFGSSKPGYAILELTPTQMKVVFKDTKGASIFSWTKTRKTTGK